MMENKELTTMASSKPAEELLGGSFLSSWELNNTQPILKKESWIELTSSVVGLKSPDRVTPLPFSSGEEYLRLLREAQRESNQSSKVVSLASSRRDTPKGSPKSPPNSPNTELCAEDELKNVYINYWHKEGEAGKDTDWVWSWSSRSDQRPQRDWRFDHPKRRPVGYSIRLARVGRNSLFSKEVLYSLLLTNVLSLLLGTGLGLWLSRRGLLITRITVE